MIKNRNGITVPELIEFLQSLPKAEHDDDIGEVWVEHFVEKCGSVSDLCYVAMKLNKNDVLLSLEKEGAE